MKLPSIPLAGLLLAACASDPNVVDPQPASEIIAHAGEAKSVFVGEVLSIENRLSEPDENGAVVPFHFVTWRVQRAVRGIEVGTTWTGRFAGGPYGDGRTLSVSEVPDFTVGQRSLVLATDGDAGSCPLVGCRDGILVVDSARAELDLERVIAALPAPAVATRARSADARAAFHFTMPVAERLTSPRNRVHTAVAPALDQERAALEANHRNPVIR